MNLLFIINQLRRTGPTNVLFDIVSEVDKSTHKVFILTLMSEDKVKSRIADFKEIEGVEIIPLNYSFLNLELQTKKIAKDIDTIIQNLKIDIVNTHGYHPLLVGSNLKSNIKVVDTLHNISYDDYTMSKGLILGSYMNMRYLYSLNKIDHCIAISNSVNNHYKKHISSAITTIYNGIDTTNYTQNISKEQITELRGEYGIEKDTIVYIVVGSLTKRKRVELIIKAFLKAFKGMDNNEVCLLFVGDGKLDKKCKQLVPNHVKSVKFAGFQNNVTNFMQISNYSICASCSEGFGLFYVESVMCGLPIISSKIAAFNEFSQLSPQLAELQFELDNQTMLEQILIKTYNKKGGEGINCSEYFKTIFSRKKMADNYISLFSSLNGDSHNPKV